MYIQPLRVISVFTRASSEKYDADLEPKADLESKDAKNTRTGA